MFMPTVLLGMTFPLVARLFTQSLYRVGSGVGSSYAANTVGAVLGAFAGGFILIPNLGVQNTIIFAVVMNLLIGAWLMISDPQAVVRAALWSRFGRVGSGGHRAVQSPPLGSAYSDQRRNDLCRPL